MSRKTRRDKNRHVFDNPRNVKTALRILYAICAGLLLIDLVYHRHALHSWEELLGFYAVYGFVACAILVLVAKQMRKLFMRKEDYYDMGD